MIDKKTIKTYACINKENNIREISTSGGTFYELARWFINEGGIICAACFDNEFNVVHDFCEDESQINRFMGSKYAPSLLAGTYAKVKEKLGKGRKVLFAGTPCQVAGLAKFLKKNYENLFLVDFICHGVPDAKVWKKYLEFLKTKGTIKKINFRNKKNSWYDYSFTVDYTDGSTFSEKMSDNAYLQAFVQNLSLRKSCYNCKSRGFNRCSDITLGDFWGVDRQVPQAYDDRGTSALFINTEKGKEIFDNIRDKFDLYEVDINAITGGNPSYFYNVEEHRKRQKFFDTIDECKDIEKLTNQCLKEPVWSKVKRKIKNIIKKLFCNV
ncbi:Coenzyme F420 hydrogenase/dehydrogenase, beta subunit C-terminal domain [uncultured Eubacterium sp.]|uniref:Coenzyme F420 hydrogenase/dehydrogenase, beta subunit C-terminal domain n=2 Tax=Eubacterium TaxID=1730 RepID=UPI002671AC90|nr:Coenzyme F420 hydrogenase/dehydrogenase, beta subunit C-terminal domain [uncultured Eubacterium sp.]